MNIIPALNGGLPPLRRGPRRKGAVNGPPERLEAAFARRLDRMARQYERIGWNVDLTNETLVLSVRLWFTHTAPPPDAESEAAKAMRRERWDGFLRSLTRNMERDSRIGSEISQDIAARAATDRDD